MPQHGMKHMVMLLQKFVQRISIEKYRKILFYQAADAEREKYQADLDQQHAEQAYSEIEKLVEKLQKDYRRAINKSQ